MRNVDDRWLWAGFGTSFVLGVLLRVLQSWTPANSVGAVVDLLLGVGFWFAMTLAAVFAVLALRLGILVPPGRNRSKTALLVGLAASLGLAFVVVLASRNWLTYISLGASETAGFASLMMDALIALLEASAGCLIALASLTFFASKDVPDVQAAVPPPTDPTHQDPAPSDQESVAS